LDFDNKQTADLRLSLTRESHRRIRVTPGQRNEVLESLYSFVSATVVTFAQELRQFHKGLSP
jgi:hypothetical protein